ncbi:hypothetical protein K443DRAFT_135246 [Laccaria amethystina LaAM-08-1]|uniref:MARVEL domain-containing protein n=1 Tax=Laccaria amethystina LaAM-08-1 TaxID=1095629 RepID=A0A0C9X8E1_9AGAR|nr:hypothetical protein K443DRAFT_135246 [Laccaria amethystina LaAM-08-1]
MSSYLYIFRNFTFSLCLTFSLANIGLVAHWTQATLFQDTLVDFEIVGPVAGGLSALVFPVFLIVSAIRKNAGFTMIAVELSVLLVIWVLWLTNSVLVIQWGRLFYPFGCSALFSPASDWCTEFFAIAKLSIMICVFLFIYWLTILVSAVVSQSRGNSKVWTTPVKDAVFFSQQAISSDSGNKTKQEMEEGTAAARASKQIHL